MSDAPPPTSTLIRPAASSDLDQVVDVLWAAGLFGGGWMGPRMVPRMVRRVSPGPLRLVIALAGIGLAVHLGLDAYT